jgi:arylsulfatase A-like enzyme
MRSCLRVILIAVCAVCGFGHRAMAQVRPNIVFIYADDVGYGDVGCYGAQKVATPNIDRLAKSGLRFTDAHCTSATCTPSRYGILTGEYPWRKNGTGVLPGNAALIIDPSRTTWPAILRKAGYVTGLVGKWHLGLGTAEHLDWNADISPGPLEVGFDEAFFIPATVDRVPCVYVQNHRVVGLDPKDPIDVKYGAQLDDAPEFEPMATHHPELMTLKPSALDKDHFGTIINGIPRIGFMRGGMSARWVDEKIEDTLNDKAVAFIERHKEKPFFLYFATHDIHVPREPDKQFLGKSELGVRGDVIDELDASVGVILAELDRLKLTENTLVIFSSDNGPVIGDGYDDGAVEHLDGHRAAGPYRGGKYSMLEGGTRVPLIVNWPGHVKAGVSDAMVDQVDFAASFAAMVGQSLGHDDAPDSLNMLAALIGDSQMGRQSLVEHAQPKRIALRHGVWKYIPPTDGLALIPATNTETGFSKQEQLYDLASDPAEKNNLAAQKPDIAKQCADELNRIRDSGRSRE